MSSRPIDGVTNGLSNFFKVVSDVITPKAILIATAIIAASTIITAIALKALGYSNVAVAVAAAIPITFSAALWVAVGALIIGGVIILVAVKIFFKNEWQANSELPPS